MRQGLKVGLPSPQVAVLAQEASREDYEGNWKHRFQDENLEVRRGGGSVVASAHSDTLRLKFVFTKIRLKMIFENVL